MNDYAIYLEDGTIIAEGTNMFFSVGQTILYKNGDKFEVIGILTHIFPEGCFHRVLARKIQ